MKKNAILDKTRRYRYVLKRKWGGGNKFVNFILLNPSKADESEDDPTIKACIKFAQNWGYDGMWVTNLFAFRSTKPNDLKQIKNPVGNNNNLYIKEYAKKSKIVIVAWGNYGIFLNRGKEIINLLKAITSPYCLEILKNGNPKHPLYIKREARPFKFVPSRRRC